MSVLNRTCFGTEADLTAALRKSLPADSPSATIVTAFAVIFRRKSRARNAREKGSKHTSPPDGAAVSHRTLSSSSFPVSSKSVRVPSGADTCDKRGQEAGRRRDGGGHEDGRRSERPLASDDVQRSPPSLPRSSTAE